MEHDPRRIVTGFVDYVGLARYAQWDGPVAGATSAGSDTSAASERPAGVLGQLRVGIIVNDQDFHLFSSVLEDMIIAVDGIVFRSHAYLAEVAEGVANHTSLTFFCALVALEAMADTTFEAFFERRVVNVELVDARLVGLRFEGARFNGKPTAEQMHGTEGGATGRVSDMLGHGMLTKSHALAHVDSRRLDRWHLAVTFGDWPRSPPWHVHDTLFVNGMAATVVRVYSDAECDVIVPPKLRATTTLVSEPLDEPRAVNIEVSSLAAVLSNAKTFRTQERTDAHFMRQAMNEGDRGRTTSGPNPWTGAVLVDNETRLVLGAASCNSVDGTHAEIACLEQARDAWPERFVGAWQSVHDAAAEAEADDDEEVEDVIDADPRDDGAAHGMTLYVTHMPCTHRLNSDNEVVTACVSLLKDYAHVLRRVVIGLNEHATAAADLQHLQKVLPDAAVVVMQDDGTELLQELRWSMREYTHWRATRLPYTTGLLVQTIDGHLVSRSTPEVKAWIDPALGPLRALAQAVIVDGDTVVLNPTAFDDLQPHDAVQIVARTHVTRGKKSKNGHATMRTRLVKQPFPLRALMTSSRLLRTLPEERAQWAPKTDALGSVLLYAPVDFVLDDVLQHGYPKDSLNDKPAVMAAVSALWPMQPHIQITPVANGSKGADLLKPAPAAVFGELGARGVVTAVVEGSRQFLNSLMAQGLISELIVLTIPRLGSHVPATEPPSAAAPPAVPYTLALIAAGQLGATDVTSAHYVVTPAPVAGEDK